MYEYAIDPFSPPFPSIRGGHQRAFNSSLFGLWALTTLLCLSIIYHLNLAQVNVDCWTTLLVRGTGSLSDLLDVC